MPGRTALKETVYGVAHATGLPALGRRKQRGALLVLTYHSFGPAQEHPYLSRLPVERFEEQLAYLQKHYRVVALEEGLRHLQKGTLDASMVALTVDDGYADNFTSLFPLIRRANVPLTVFLATDYLDSGRLPWPTRISAMLHYATRKGISTPLPLTLATPAERAVAGRTARETLSRMDNGSRERMLFALQEALAPLPHETLRPLMWDEVREMAGAGVHFGAHTHYHGWLDRLDAAEVDEELKYSRRRVEEETGKPCRVLAYPNGNWSEAVAQAAQRAGYDLALTQDRGTNRRVDLQPYAMRRLQVPEDERIGTFACRVSEIAL